jgi:thiamine biosynthesis lipoprotein
VLRCAISVADLSGGAYDPTAGALVDVWGFGPHGHPCCPDAAAIAAARQNCDWRRIRLDGARVFQPGGLRLDFSSIAKGFAVDKVSAHLDSLGVADHLVEIGGELIGRGTKPDGGPWWVAVDQSCSGEGSAQAGETIVALHGLAIATSGDGQRYFERDGRRLSHTIDPRTGYPVLGRLASVTVLHRRCMQADALATALLVLGPEEGFSLAVRQNLAARFVLRGGGKLETRMTPAMSAMLTD